MLVFSLIYLIRSDFDVVGPILEQIIYLSSNEINMSLPAQSEYKFNQCGKYVKINAGSQLTIDIDCPLVTLIEIFPSSQLFLKVQGPVAVLIYGQTQVITELVADVSLKHFPCILGTATQSVTTIRTIGSSSEPMEAIMSSMVSHQDVVTSEDFLFIPEIRLTTNGEYYFLNGKNTISIKGVSTKGLVYFPARKLGTIYSIGGIVGVVAVAGIGIFLFNQQNKGKNRHDSSTSSSSS